MIRQLLIVLGVMSLELGSQGIGLAAIICPEAPEQTSRDYDADISGAVAKLRRFSGVELKMQAEYVTKDLMGKLPGADRVYLEQMMYATYCSALNEDKTLTDSERRKELREYNADVRKVPELPASKAKQPTGAPQIKQAGKGKVSGTRSHLNPPVMPPQQAETKQPVVEKPCEQSITGLTRRPEEFRPEWRSWLSSFRKQRDTHDLLTLFKFRGRIPVGLAGKDLIHEASYTLNCMEQNGELTMKKLGGTSGL